MAFVAFFAFLADVFNSIMNSFRGASPKIVDSPKAATDGAEPKEIEGNKPCANVGRFEKGGTKRRGDNVKAAFVRQSAVDIPDENACSSQMP